MKIKSYNYKTILFVFLAFLFFTSCIPQKKLTYLQDKKIRERVKEELLVQDKQITDNYTIQPNDALFISISSIDKKTTEFFNSLGGENLNYNPDNQMLSGYSVSDSGTIYLPILGEIYLLNSTPKDAREIIEERLKPYVSNAKVIVKLMNNTISVLGEVNFQGNYRVTKSKLSIFEAISLAGGLTDYAKLDNIQVIRDTGNGPEVFAIDISSKDVFDYKSYYIMPNDIIYFKPMRAKSFGVNSSVGVITSLTSVLTLYLLIKTIK